MSEAPFPDKIWISRKKSKKGIEGGPFKCSLYGIGLGYVRESPIPELMRKQVIQELADEAAEWEAKCEEADQPQHRLCWRDTKEWLQEKVGLRAKGPEVPRG